MSSPGASGLEGGPAAGAASAKLEDSGRAGLAALLALLLAWKWYSLASGNFRIQEEWTRWQYLSSFPQDLCLFAAVFVAWDLLFSRRGRVGLAITLVLALLLCFAQIVDARMKVRFLHPLSVQWLRYAIAEAKTIGPDYAVFTGGTYWKLALASLAVLAGAFAAPWIPGLRAAAAALGALERRLKLRLCARAALAPLVALAFFAPAQPYGLHRNFALALVLPLDKPVVGHDHHERLKSEAPIALSSAQSFAHTRDPALALCKGRNVVLYVIESLAREQTALGAAGPQSTPVLARMLADGGAQAVCYAQFANSAKATFGLLSGVYAAQTMEVLECQMETMSGLPRALADAGWFTVCLTPQHLYYQGQRTMFQKLGFRELLTFLDFQALAQKEGRPFDETGPASRDDRMVFAWDHAQLAARAPFFATYYTMSSHYRYHFPGQTPGGDEERHRRAVRYTDQVLGELLEDFRRRGLYEKTLFVVTSDHGEDFRGGKFLPRHSSLTQNAHEVPLVFFAPGVDLSQLALGRARHVDLLPTILDLVGLAPEGLPLSGESLLGGAGERVVFLQSYGTERTAALIDGARKWMWNLESDTRWTVDLASDPRGASPQRVDAASPEWLRAGAEAATKRIQDFAIYNEAFLRDVVAGRAGAGRTPLAAASK